MGKPLVMGRKTFESIGRVLDGRDIIVVTRRADFAPAGAIVATASRRRSSSPRSAPRRAGRQKSASVGGGEIYAATLPLAQRLYVTHVPGSPEGDVHFPEISSRRNGRGLARAAAVQRGRYSDRASTSSTSGAR